MAGIAMLLLVHAMQKTASAPNIPASSTSSRNTIRAQVWKQPSTERASTRWLAPKGEWSLEYLFYIKRWENQTETIILSTAKENYANYTYLGAGNDSKDAKRMASSWDYPTSADL